MSSNPVVLITGAAKRIGASVSQLFHHKGYDVIIHFNKSLSQALELQSSLNRLRKNSCHIIQADLCNKSETSNLAIESLACFQRLDVLVNNASNFYSTPLEGATHSQWDDLIDSNLRAAFFLSQQLSPSLRERSGAIVNIIDIHGDKALKDYPIYSIAKAGLKMMTKSLARELAPSVRVNGVSPGAILWPETGPKMGPEMGPKEGAKQTGLTEDAPAHRNILDQICLQRLGTPEEIANTVYFLATQASYLTGQVIKVDGGRSLS